MALKNHLCRNCGHEIDLEETDERFFCSAKCNTAFAYAMASAGHRTAAYERAAEAQNRLRKKS
jgi:endogenous inhibitor of DNA gyrase (YacG/DUF329 family)